MGRDDVYFDDDETLRRDRVELLRTGDEGVQTYTTNRFVWPYRLGYDVAETDASYCIDAPDVMPGGSMAFGDFGPEQTWALRADAVLG